MVTSNLFTSIIKLVLRGIIADLNSILICYSSTLRYLILFLLCFKVKEKGFINFRWIQVNNFWNKNFLFKFYFHSCFYCTLYVNLSSNLKAIFHSYIRKNRTFSTKNFQLFLEKDEQRIQMKKTLMIF